MPPKTPSPPPREPALSQSKIINRKSEIQMPSLHHDYPMPAWTAWLALAVILASGVALFSLSL